jgi:hypothetical protein
MNRREFLSGASALSLFSGLARSDAAAAVSPQTGRAAARVRPGDAAWPSPERWNELRRQTGGRLAAIQSPLNACRDAPDGAACRDLFRELKNPYYIGDNVALTQTTGWVDAWTMRESVYAVEAETTGDVVAAVNFARENNLRLVVKGGAHSYLGTSNAPDSLLIWTRRMHDIVLHDAFIARNSHAPPQPAVSVGAGAIWMHTYTEVTTKGGRYVQGGGCGTVGVAGLVLGGGFGTYSKNYGTAAAGLIEAEVVTADGVARIANAETNADLFWALKGGGGGSFGVVTRMTLRTRDLPRTIGIVLANIDAHSADAFRRLIDRFLAFYAEKLLTPNWGEIVNVKPSNRLEIHLEFQGLEQAEVEALWRPFFEWVTAASGNFTFSAPPRIFSGPPRHRWDADYLLARAPGSVLFDDRPDASKDNFFWQANLAEAGHFIHGFESTWLPAPLLAEDQRQRLTDALFATSRLWSIELHFQKGLAGASAQTIAATAGTATNPAVLDAFCLAIIASESAPAYPGLGGQHGGHEPNLAKARRDAQAIRRATDELRKAVPVAGSYVAESGYFERDWRQCYWGSNYPKLARIKQTYDPDGLFFVHHGVGSEDWSADGFTRVPGP